MNQYKLTNCDSILKINGDEILSIPADEKNRDYQEYLSWLAEGNTPDAADPEPMEKKYVSCKDIIERLSALGKYEIVKGAMSEVQKDIFFSLKEGIATDDADVIALLTACGVDYTQVLY